MSLSNYFISKFLRVYMKKLFYRTVTNGGRNRTVVRVFCLVSLPNHVRRGGGAKRRGGLTGRETWDFPPKVVPAEETNKTDCLGLGSPVTS